MPAHDDERERTRVTRSTVATPPSADTGVVVSSRATRGSRRRPKIERRALALAGALTVAAAALLGPVRQIDGHVRPLPQDQCGAGRTACSDSQRQTLTLTVTHDAFVADGAVWREKALGAEKVLYVGETINQDLGYTESYLRFRLPRLPRDIQILRSTLGLYLLDGTFSASRPTLPVELHAMTSEWDESHVRWSSRPEPDGTALLAALSLRADEGARDRLHTWEVPPDEVRSWLENETQDLGLKLIVPRTGNPGRFFRAFASKELEAGARAPRLTLEYALPTAAPTSTPTPWLQLQIAAEPRSAIALELGDSLGITITVRNAGPVTVHDVRIEGAVPPGTTIDTVREPPRNVYATREAHQVVWLTGAMAHGDWEEVAYSLQLGPTRTATPTDMPTPTATATATASPTATTTPTVTFEPTEPGAAPASPAVEDNSITESATPTATTAPAPTHPPSPPAQLLATRESTFTRRSAGSPAVAPNAASTSGADRVVRLIVCAQASSREVVHPVAACLHIGTHSLYLPLAETGQRAASGLTGRAADSP